MSILYKTPYNANEIKDILKQELKTNAYFNWNKDCYLGRSTKNKFKYTFHEAYIRNSFTKALVGRIYNENGETYIRVRLISILFDIKFILFIHFFLGIIITLNYLMDNIKYTFIDIIVRLFFSGFVFSGFILIVGLIVTLIPTSEKNRERLTILLEEKLLATRVQ